MMTPEEFGERLRHLRERAYIYNQKEFATKAGVPVGSLRHWEQGLRLPSLANAVKLAEALDISLDKLAGRKRVKKAGGEQFVCARCFLEFEVPCGQEIPFDGEMLCPYPHCGGKSRCRG